MGCSSPKAEGQFIIILASHCVCPRTDSEPPLHCSRSGQTIRVARASEEMLAEKEAGGQGSLTKGLITLSILQAHVGT